MIPRKILRATTLFCVLAIIVPIFLPQRCPPQASNGALLYHEPRYCSAQQLDGALSYHEPHYCSAQQLDGALSYHEPHYCSAQQLDGALSYHGPRYCPAQQLDGALSYHEPRYCSAQQLDGALSYHGPRYCPAQVSNGALLYHEPHYCSAQQLPTTGAEENPRLFLSVCEKDEMIEVEISLKSRTGICALLARLEYNGDSLLFLSGGAECKDFNFKCVDFGDCVGFLLDSLENSPDECVLARFYFKRIGTGAERFSLKCQKNGTLYLDGKETKAACEAEVVYVAGDTNEEGITKEDGAGDTDEVRAPKLLSLEVREQDGSATICFSVRVGEDCFAGGVRLFCADTSGAGRHFSVYVVGIVESDGVFSGEYNLNGKSDCAFIVTPIEYKRNKIEKGDKTVMLLKGS